jgi:hypothetical protein
MPKLKYFVPILLAFICFCIYMYTAAPFMAWMDALDFVAASVSLGINNPPAPLYVFIGHLFTLLPFGSVIFRMQLFSALTAAASLFLIYQIIVWTGEQITKSRTDKHSNKKKQQLQVNEKVDEKNFMFPALFGVLTLAFSYEFWSQAQNTEKFILECFFELLILYLITVVLTSQKKAFPLLYLVCFLLGLSTGIDPVVVSFFPSVLLVLWEKRHDLNVKKLVLLGAAGLAGVILVYSYLPIMSARNPFMNYGRPTNLTAILNVATGHWSNNKDIGFTGSADVFFTSSWHFLTNVWLYFTPLLLPFMLLGGWYLWKMQKRLFWLFTLIIVTNFLLSVFYLSGNQDLWYLLPDVSFAIFAGLGYFWLIRKLSKRWYTFLLLLVSLVPLVYWWPSLDRHGWRISEDYIHNLYTPIKEPAILFGGGDYFTSTSYYAHEVSKYKPAAVPIVDSYFFRNMPYRENLLTTTHIQIPDATKYPPNTADGYSAFVNDFFAMNLPKYKIYINYPALILTPLPRSDGTASLRIDTNRFKLIPAGLAEEVVPKDSNEQPDLHDFDYQFQNGFPNRKPTLLEQNYKIQLEEMTIEYAFFYDDIGDYVLQQGEVNQALDFYQKAYVMNPHIGVVLGKLGVLYSRQNQPTKALAYFNKAFTTQPDNVTWLYDIG